MARHRCRAVRFRSRAHCLHRLVPSASTTVAEFVDHSRRFGRSSWIRPLSRAGRAAVWFVLPEGAVGTVRRGEERSPQRRRSDRDRASRLGPVDRRSGTWPAAITSRLVCPGVATASHWFLRAFSCPRRIARGRRDVPPTLGRLDGAERYANEPRTPSGFPTSSRSSSRSRAAAATSTSTTRRPASSGSTASSRRPSTTTSTTGSSRAREPATATTPTPSS